MVLAGSGAMRAAPEPITRGRGRQAVLTRASLASDSKVLIVGGGIVGASVAYHLTLKGVHPTVLERVGVASAASGKAGGFLARHWGDGSVTQGLHQVSFDMHKELADTLGLESWRALPTLSVEPGRRGRSKPAASWLDGQVARADVMDTRTAQVTPLELTTKLMAAAQASGAEVRIGNVTGCAFSDAEGGGRAITGVHLEGGETIEADHVVFTMGPWTAVAGDWLGMDLPMQGIKSVSLVYEGRQAVVDEPYAAFCAEDVNDCHLELYPRPNGEIYICGCGGSDYVEGDRLRAGGDLESAAHVTTDQSRVEAASRSFQSMSSLGNGGPDRTQTCMRPCLTDALPVMGEVPGIKGAVLCAGHNCWGILWAPVSGAAIAELLVDGESSVVDLRPFSPARFMARKAGGRGKSAGGQAIGEQW